MNGTVGFALAKRISLAYTVEGLLDSKDAGSFGLSHEVLIGYRFGDSRKTEEELKRIKERLDGHDQQIMASGKRIDSLGKTHDDRLANLESKTAAHDQQLNNNKTAIDKTNSDLNAQGGRLTNAEKDIKDLREKGSNNSNSTNIQKSGSDIAYRKMGAVFFKVNSSELTAESKSQLDALKAALASKKGNFMIYIAGNASTEGSANDNLLLSLRRSAAVKGYLEKAGITQPVLILANGEEVPETAKQTTDPERKQHRRVDIIISGE